MATDKYVYNVPDGKGGFYSGPASGAPQAQMAPSVPTTPSSPAPQDTAAVTPPTFPQIELQPGNSGDNVKSLQDYLVSIGLMTPEQVATGPGIYGPQTQAAVEALQQQLGVDNSTGPGYFGPRTIAALSQMSTPTMPGQETPQEGEAEPMPEQEGEAEAVQADPIDQVFETYSRVYKELGLGSIKTEYERVLKDQADLQSELADKILDLNNNPWLSEGIRTKRIEKLRESYETRTKTLSNLEVLYDSMYKTGLSQANQMIGYVEDVKAVAAEAARKREEAAASLAKDNLVEEIDGRVLLISRVTGKVVADLGPVTEDPGDAEDFTLSPGSVRFDASGRVIASVARAPAEAAKGTADERAQDAVSELQFLIDSGQPLKGGVQVLDSTGFITPDAWKKLIASAPSAGLSRAKFIENFGYRIPTDKKGKISTSYGLTPVEIKTITGALPR